MTEFAGKSLMIEGCMAENGNRLEGALGSALQGQRMRTKGVTVAILELGSFQVIYRIFFRHS